MKKWLIFRAACCLAICFALPCLLFSALGGQGTVYAYSRHRGLVNVYPLTRYITRMHNGQAPPCLSRRVPPLCYSPHQIQTAYALLPLLNAGIRGQNQTIVIIDAYQNPTIRADLRLFNRLFGLPDAPLEILAPFGLHPFNETNPIAASFALEIALDVQWAHAIAPGARIRLVLGNPVNDSNRGQIDALISATRYAVNNNLGSVLSLSVGAGETCFTPTEIQSWHSVFRQARDLRISTFVSSGDTGSDAGVCDASGNPVSDAPSVSYPASDPLVTAVGGTTLYANANGAYQRETAWNRSVQAAGATGGGFSAIFPRPAYQNGVPGIAGRRGIPDVAYDGDPFTAVPVVTSSYLPGVTAIIPVGGTSAGTPQWAALTALANQELRMRLGFLNGAIYRIGASRAYEQAFHDITIGNNTFSFPAPNGGLITIPGFNATPRWDAVTGFGSPRSSALPRLLARNVRPGDGL